MSRPVYRLLLAVALGPIALPAAAQQRAVLAAEWTVDLRPTPHAPACLKPKTLSVTADGALTGMFYKHSIDLGRADAINGRSCFAFRTWDTSGPYQTWAALSAITSRARPGLKGGVSF